MQSGKTRFSPARLLPFLTPLGHIALASAVVLAPAALHAQNITSSISGTVTDPSGAIIPNAKVVATNSGTGQQLTTTTDASGIYTITNIQPGTYSVTASAKGFSTQNIQGAVVDPNIGRQANFTLTAGAETTTVNVQANANALQVESAVVGQLVTQEQVKGIQLNGRDPLYLSQLEPGVVRNAPLSSFNFDPDFGGPQISGARNDEINITLDGAPMIRTRGNGTTTGVPDVDTIDSMQVLSTTYPAQYGGTSGGVLVEVPKMGTKDFHGSAYEYLRNSFFNANTWINKQSSDPATADHPPAFRFNQFGWNFNGPVAIPGKWEGLRNKLFFLVGQEYLRFRQTPTQTGTVPTALMRQGNFSELLSPNIFYPTGTTIKDPTTGVNYANNVIPTGELSNQGLALMAAFPAPNVNGPSYNWEASAAYPQNQRKDTATLDYLISPSQQLRISFLHYTYYQSSPFSDSFTGIPQVWHWPDEVAVAHHTWTINPHLINDFTASGSTDHVTITNDLTSGDYNRTNYGINFPYLFPAAEKLIPNKIPTVEFEDQFTTLNGGPYPSHSGGIVIVLSDALTKIVGNHTFQFGGQWEYSGENNFDQIDVSDTTPGATNNQNGQFEFTDTNGGQPTTGLGIANAALGNFTTYGEIGQKNYTLFRGNSGEFFAQDSWRMNPHTVVEYGARYSIFQNYFAKWNNQSFFDPAYYTAGDAPVVNPTTGTETGGNQYDGVVIPGSGYPSSATGHVNAAVISSTAGLFHNLSRSYSPTIWTYIQPRVGVTSQIGPNTVVRFGGGRFVQRTGISDSLQLGGNPPFQIAESVTNGNVANPGGTTAATYPLQMSSQAYNFAAPEAWAWSAAFEQDIPKLATLTIGYVGRKGVHLTQLVQLDQLQPGTIQANPTVTAEDALRPYQGFSSIITQTDGGSSLYNGMQVGLKRRMTNHLLFGVAYTWSKITDFGSSKGFLLPDRFAPKNFYGPADFDIRQVLVVDYVYDITYMDHANSRLLRSTLGGWQLSGVTQAQTGEPFSVDNGNDYAGVGVGAGNQYWDHTSTVHLPHQFGTGDWFDPTAFTAPAAGTIAPRGSRNGWYNPGFQSWNAALVKSFHVFHDNQVQFRAEAFNFPNHPNWDDPNTTPGSSTFGEITTKGQTYSSDREWQFSLRYQF